MNFPYGITPEGPGSILTIGFPRSLKVVFLINVCDADVEYTIKGKVYWEF